MNLSIERFSVERSLTIGTLLALAAGVAALATTRAGSGACDSVSSSRGTRAGGARV